MKKMQWTTEAESAIQKVPFFVRKKVRARVESEALQNGRGQITLAEVEATRKHYLKGMHAEVKGYQLDSCFGPSGCLNALGSSRELAEKIENILKDADFLMFLMSRGVQEPKFHHEFRVSVTDCPNACSQPQIKDIGIIAARLPQITDSPCNGCEACAESCREGAVEIGNADGTPTVDTRRCVACGQCIGACPGGTLGIAAEGYRVQLGGKLGRHPRLAQEIDGIFDTDTVLEIIQAAIEVYKKRSAKGERFGEILKPEDFATLLRRFGPKALYRTPARR